MNIGLQFVHNYDKMNQAEFVKNKFQYQPGDKCQNPKVKALEPLKTGYAQCLARKAIILFFSVCNVMQPTIGM